MCYCRLVLQQVLQHSLFYIIYCTLIICLVSLGYNYHGYHRNIIISSCDKGIQWLISDAKGGKSFSLQQTSGHKIGHIYIPDCVVLKVLLSSSPDNIPCHILFLSNLHFTWKLIRILFMQLLCGGSIITTNR